MMILVYRCIKRREPSYASPEMCVLLWDEKEVKERLFFLPLRTGPTHASTPPRAHFHPLQQEFSSQSLWSKFYPYKFLRGLNHQHNALEPLWSSLPNSTFLSTTKCGKDTMFPYSFHIKKLPPTGTRKCMSLWITICYSSSPPGSAGVSHTKGESGAWGGCKASLLRPARPCPPERPSRQWGPGAGSTWGSGYLNATETAILPKRVRERAAEGVRELSECLRRSEICAGIIREELGWAASSLSSGSRSRSRRRSSSPEGRARLRPLGSAQGEARAPQPPPRRAHGPGGSGRTKAAATRVAFSIQAFDSRSLPSPLPKARMAGPGENLGQRWP